MAKIDWREQIKKVHAEYPQLKVTRSGPWLIVWEGRLIGWDLPYLVRIIWYHSDPWRNFELENSRSPEIYVLDPPLQARGKDYVPHLYRRKLTPNGTPSPYLCLHDPAKDEWGADQHIADTVIPWASQWLASYEIWHVSGKNWPAPGVIQKEINRHVVPKIKARNHLRAAINGNALSRAETPSLAARSGLSHPFH